MILTPVEANVLRCLKIEPLEANLFRTVMPGLIEKGLARLGQHRTNFYFPTEEGLKTDV